MSSFRISVFIPTNIQVFYLFQDALAGYICRILLQKRKVILIFLSARHNIIAKVLCQFKDSTSQPKTQQIKETNLNKHCRMRNFPFYLVQRSDIRGDANRWMPDPTFPYILPDGKITVAVVLAGTSTVNSNESASILQSERTGPYRD